MFKEDSGLGLRIRSVTSDFQISQNSWPGITKKKKKKQPKIKQVVGSGKMHIQAITLKWNVHEAQQTTRGSRNNKKKIVEVLILIKDHYKNLKSLL